MLIQNVRSLNVMHENQNPDHYYYEGCALLDVGNYVEAIDRFNKAIEISTTKSEYWDRRGTAYFGIKNYIQSINDYTKAISLSPNNGFYYEERALCYYAIGATDEMFKDLKAAARLGDVTCQEILKKYGVNW